MTSPGGSATAGSCRCAAAIVSVLMSTSVGGPTPPPVNGTAFEAADQQPSYVPHRASSSHYSTSHPQVRLTSAAPGVGRKRAPQNPSAPRVFGQFPTDPPHVGTKCPANFPSTER